MDKFPEAFERFEEDVDVREIRSFKELRLAFSSWAGKKWKETPRQIKALRVEARRIGIPVPIRRIKKKRIVYREIPKVRKETITRYNKSVTIYRDIKTGRFVSRRDIPRREIRRDISRREIRR